MTASKDRVRLHAKQTRWAESHNCSICGESIDSFEKATLDHIVPRSLGGRTRLMNLKLAHMKCNSKKQSTMRYFSTDMMRCFDIIPSRLNPDGTPKL